MSYHDESNKLHFVIFWTLDEEIIWFENFVKNKIFVNFANFDMQKCQDVSPSIGHRDFYYSSLDSSRWDALNGGRFVSLASLDEMLFTFYCLENFENNFLSIGPREINILPFNASHQGKSNKLHFIIFWSLECDLLVWKKARTVYIIVVLFLLSCSFKFFIFIVFI